MGWEDQGRQAHGWFGHGTAPPKPDESDGGGRFGPDSLDQRLRAMGHTAIAAIPRRLRYHPAAGYEGAALDQLVTTMRAWVRGLLLDRAEFASRYFGRGVSDPVVGHLWQAAKFAVIACNEAELRAGTEHLAAAMQVVGLDRWRRFINDAQQRAAAAACLPVPALNGNPKPVATSEGRVGPANTPNTAGFDPNNVQLASDEPGKRLKDLENLSPQDKLAVEEGLETPEQARAHSGPQIAPGLGSPYPTIPLLGGGTRGLAAESATLRAAAQGKGNFGIGQATTETANRLGRAWVGDNPILASDGRTLISQDGLRQYRPPSFKPNLGRVQANFEQRSFPNGQWQSNGHLDIVK